MDEVDSRMSDLQRFLRDLARAFPHKKSAVAAAISELNTTTDDNVANFCEYLSVHELEVLRAVLRLIMWWPLFGEEP
jgi:hypothetical protein